MEPDTNIPNNPESNSREGLGGYVLGAAVILIIGIGGYFALSGKTAMAPTETNPIPTGTEEAVMVNTPVSVDTPVSVETPVLGTTTKKEMVKEKAPAILVSLGDSGFEPKEVTIKKGATVRFVNNSARDSWPASAIHPTHSIYPQKSASDCLGSSFDACRGLKPGEFWEFTFNVAGTWRFHDHLNASKTGSIIVQ